MSLSVAAMQKLVDLGLSAQDIVEVARLNEVAADSAAEKRRQFDRDRKRAKAEALRNSGGNSGGIDAERSGGNPVEFPPERPALARVEGNNLPSEIAGDYTTLNKCAGAIIWPPSNPAVAAELDALEALLRQEASPAVNQSAPMICSLAPILNLAQPGTGPPCDFYADVLPVIRARSKSTKPNTVNTWAFFVKPILEARDRRLQDLPNVELLDEHRRTAPASAKHAARQANFERAIAGFEAVAGRLPQR